MVNDNKNREVTSSRPGFNENEFIVGQGHADIAGGCLRLDVGWTNIICMGG